METIIIKYNAGNIQSVLFALERIGEKALVTDDHELIQQAKRIIFPGVGEASTAMEYLRKRKLDQLIRNLKQPVLGICLGMQLMCKYSAENETDCLGIFDEDVQKFEPLSSGLKVPQIGWNNVFDLKSPLFNGISENSFFYFVHSYFASLGKHTIGTSDYIQPYSAALNRDNFFGVQFHPEKSAVAGEMLLKNFILMQ